MAARGLTSRTIAEQLFVTQKTVETHLGHIYRKLDISGRKHIAEALGEAQSSGTAPDASNAKLRQGDRDSQRGNDDGERR